LEFKLKKEQELNQDIRMQIMWKMGQLLNLVKKFGQIRKL